MLDAATPSHDASRPPLRNFSSPNHKIDKVMPRRCRSISKVLRASTKIVKCRGKWRGVSWSYGNRCSMPECARVRSQ
eukprot:2294410-Amphidinium_carterae.1